MALSANIIQVLYQMESFAFNFKEGAKMKHES